MDAHASWWLNFEEKHCTVIKEGPKVAPTLKMSKTTREGPISNYFNW
jgi:hypothetical protein